MYKYIQNTNLNNLIPDLNDLADHIYNISFDIIKKQFKGNDDIEINLNPFLRTIYILKIAHEYIHKKLKIYDCLHLNISVISKNKNNKARNIKINRYLNNCKECLKCLYVYNGEMIFNVPEYSINNKFNSIEINSDSYSYSDIEKFTNKYLTIDEINNLKKYCIFNNNMYEEHVDFPQFLKINYLFVYNLMCYQSYIHDNEIKNIKNYIKKMLINSITNNKIKNNENNNNIPNDIPNNNPNSNISNEISTNINNNNNPNNNIHNEISTNIHNNNEIHNNNIPNNNIVLYLNFKYFDFFKKYLHENDDECILIKFYDDNSKDNITLSYKIDNVNEIFNYLSEKEINVYRSIQITHLLDFIKKEYVEVLDFNPYAIKFKNIINTPDAFSFKYLYDEYQTIYSDLN